MQVGKVYLSRYANLIVPCREPQVQYFPDGRERQIRPGLYAEFGAYAGPDYELEGYTTAYTADLHPGEGFSGADIRGGVFDLDKQAKEKGWTDEEKQHVSDWLSYLLMDPDNPCKGDFWEWEPKTPQPPWPSYEKTHHNAVAKIARDTGTVVEAIRYEQATRNSEHVLVALQKELDELQAEQALTAA